MPPPIPLHSPSSHGPLPLPTFPLHACPALQGTQDGIAKTVCPPGILCVPALMCLVQSSALKLWGGNKISIPRIFSPELRKGSSCCHFFSLWPALPPEVTEHWAKNVSSANSRAHPGIKGRTRNHSLRWFVLTSYPDGSIQLLFRTYPQILVRTSRVQMVPRVFAHASLIAFNRLFCNYWLMFLDLLPA